MKKQSIGKGFAVLSMAGMAVKILSLMYIPFLLAIIGDEGNGIYAAAYQVYVFIYVLANSGTPVAISKLVAELLAVGNVRDAVRTFRIARSFLLVAGVVLSTLMFLLARPLANFIHYPRAYLAIVALSPSILFTSIACAYRGYFQGRGNMVPTGISQVLEQVVNTIFTLIFAALLLRYGLEAACAGGTIGTSLGALVSACTLIWFYERKGRFTARERMHPGIRRYQYKELVRKILKYSVPITLCVGLQYAGNLVDVLNTKARLLTAGFEDAQATQLYSYLSKYQQLMNVPVSLIIALAVAMLPAISGAVALNDRRDIQKKINYAFRLCYIIALPAAVGLSVLSDPIYHMLKFRGGSMLMLYGSFILILSGTVQIQTTLLQGANRLYTVTLHLVLGITIKILLNYFLIVQPQINIYGAIIGSFAGYLVPLVLNQRLLRSALKVKVKTLSHMIKPGLAAALMGGCVFWVYEGIVSIPGFTSGTYITNMAATLISIASGALVYTYALAILKGITRSDLDSLPPSLLRWIPKSLQALIH